MVEHIMSNDIKFSLSSNEIVTLYSTEVEYIMAIFSNACLVTDMSQVYDFLEILPGKHKMYRGSPADYKKHKQNNTLTEIECSWIEDDKSLTLNYNNQIMERLKSLFDGICEVTEESYISELALKLHFHKKSKKIH